MKSTQKKIAALLLAAAAVCSFIPLSLIAGAQAPDVQPAAMAIPITGDPTNYAAIIAVVSGAVAILLIAILLGMRKKSGK